MSVKSKIQALIAAANAKTGESATDLTGAVQDLVDGYGGGITPSGKKLITDTSETDVAAFATAQISSDTLLAENIKKDVNILGILGTFAGGGGSLPAKITDINAGIVTWAQNYTANSDQPNCAKIAHGLSTTPNFAMCYAIDGYPLDAACRIASWTNNAGAKNVAWGVYQAANGNISSTANNWNIIRIDAVNLNVGAYSAFPITSGTRMIWIAAVLDLT